MTGNPKIRALLEKKQKLSMQAKQINDRAKAEDRDITIGEQRQFDGLMLEMRQVGEAVDAEMQSIEAERGAQTLLPADPLAQLGGGNLQYLDDRRAPTGRRYAQMFPGARLDAGGFRHFGEFCSVLRTGMPDPRLQIAAATGGSEGVGADGGALVPVGFIAELMDASLEDEIVRPRATVRPMESNSIVAAGWDTLNHGTSIGGFDAKWTAEGTQFTFQKALIRPMTLRAAKLGLLTAGTNELVADSSFFRLELPELMTAAIGFGLDEAFLRGDGVGKPKGALSDPALITVNKEASQAADTITWNNLKEMFGRLHPKSQTKAVWVASNTCKVQLLSLVQFIPNTGTAVAGTWIPAMREQDGKFFILGLEVLFTEKVPVLGDLGDIMLVDFSQYMIGLRGQMTIASSMHLLFDKDEIAFRGVLRADGQGRWNAPVIPRNGSAANSLSWCVTLEARA